VVVVVVAGGSISASASATNASTFVSMLEASVDVVQPPLSSAFANAEASLSPHFCRHAVSTALPFAAALAMHFSLQEHFLPAPRSFADAQSFSFGSSVHSSLRRS